MSNASDVVDAGPTAAITEPSAPSPTFRYTAFISYSHRDEKLSRRLHRELESYRVPKQLVGSRTPNGPVPPSLFPVFRDREELAPGALLSTRIKAALETSAFLIVICSPDAPKSDWVNQEIIEFKKLRGPDRILPLIASGDVRPDARGVSCFPAALCSPSAGDNPSGPVLELPLAADARPEGDGLEGAKLKLIAAILGVELNDLRRREVEAARRRARVSQAIAAAMVLLAGAAAFAAYLAVVNSREAVSQRDAALTRESKLLAIEASRQAREGSGEEALRTSLRAANPGGDDKLSSLTDDTVAAVATAMRAPLAHHDVDDPSVRFLGARFSYDESRILVRTTRSDDAGFVAVYDGASGMRAFDVQGDLVNPLDTVSLGATQPMSGLVFYRPFDREDQTVLFRQHGALVEPPKELVLPLSRVVSDGATRSVLELRDGSFRLLNKEGELRIESTPLAAGSRVVATDASARFLLSTEASGAVTLWNLDDKARVAGPFSLPATPRVAAVSPDGRRVLALALDGQAWRGILLSTDYGAKSTELMLMPNAQLAESLGGGDLADIVAGVAFDGDSERVVVFWSFGEVWRWDLAGRLVGRMVLPRRSDGPMLLSPNGTWAALGPHVWMTRTSAGDRPLLMAPEENVRRDEPDHPTGADVQQGLTAGQTTDRDGFFVDESNQITVPAVGVFRVVDPLHAPPRGGAARWVVGSRELQRNGEAEHEVAVLDLVQRTIVHSFRRPTAPTAAVVNRDGTRVAVFADEVGVIVDTKSGSISKAFRHDASIVSGIRTVVTDALFLHDDLLVTAGTDGTIRQWSLPGPVELLRDTSVDNYPDHLRPSSDEKYVVAVYPGLEGADGLRPIDVVPERKELLRDAREAALSQKNTRHRSGSCSIPSIEVRDAAFKRAGLSDAVEGMDELDRDLIYMRACGGSADRVLAEHPSLPQSSVERLVSVIGGGGPH